MKNTIGILLLLLLLLIGTCVYQKTYTLYAINHSNDDNTTQKEDKQLQLVNTAILIPIQEKQAPSKKPVQLLSKESMVEKDVPKETSIFEQIKASVISAVTSEEESKNDTPNTQTSSIKTAENNTIDTKVKEKEVVDYLLKVLKERDSTLTQRDESESKLQALIKKVLEERQIAIETMEQHAATVQKEHEARLKHRDETANAIYEKYTENKGK